MRASRLITFLSAVACLAAATVLRAQTVQCLAPNLEEGFQPNASGNSLLVDPTSDPSNPAIFVGTTRYTGGGSTLFRLTPTDAAASSFTVQPLDAALSSVKGLVNNPGDGLYAVGRGVKDPAAKNMVDAWRVLKSVNGGATWAEDGPPYLFDKNNSSWAQEITADKWRNLYACGVGVESRTSHWIIRRKIPGGVWTTVFDAKNPNINMLPSLCFFPGNPANSTPAIIATSDLNSKWTVMRSQDQGTSWLPLDAWTGGGTEASPYHAMCDPQTGYIYVVGCRGINGRNPSAWVVSVSTNGGNSWRLLLDVPGAGSWASRATVDSAGNVWVSGVINTGQPLWKVIRCPNPPDRDAWTASYANGLLPFGNTYSKATGIAGAAGNVFSTGLLSNWIDDSTTPATTYSGNWLGLVRIIPGSW